MANILGINLSEFNQRQVLEKIIEFLGDSQQHYIVTPNPEIILEAHRDEEFFYILNQADLSLADGFGLQIATRLFGDKVPRITGSNLTPQLLKLAQEKNIKIGIINRQDGLSTKKEIEIALQKKYPQLEYLVIDVDNPIFLSEEKKQIINNFSAQILFVSLGFPQQEKLIYHQLKNMTSVKIALGIGGTFDFIAGKIKRAPNWLQYLGLEWLWRLIKQPNRYKRIYNATIVFLSKVIKARFINPFLYRPNVACWLYKKNQGQIKILLVEREDEPGHWQLPQGGLDGESLEVAGARELREEIGTSNFVTRGNFKNLYYYKFPGDGEKKFYKYDYKGQKQGLYVAEYQGDDSDIRVCFWDHRSWKWVNIERLLTEVYPIRQKSAKIFLDKFKSLNIT